MSKKLIPLFLLILLTGSLAAQNLLNNPESVAFDALNNRYLASNYGDGSIVQIETDLVTQSYYKTNVGNFCLSNCIKDNVFYTSVNGQKVVGFDLTNDQQVMDVTIPNTGHLDGMTADNSGNVYVLETSRGIIFKIEISSQTYSTFATGLGASPQDLFFDATNSRILVCKYTAAPSPIYSVDITDGSVTTAVMTGSGYFDGITQDADGNTYLSSHYAGGRVYRYSPDFSTVTLVAYTPPEPAGLDYNVRDNILAVPNFSANRIDFFSFNDVDEDGILDYKDNCPNNANPLQEDSDGDGFGDACDLCPGYNDNIDADADGVPDACDICPGADDLVDTDLDGLPDGCDNCPEVYNDGQEDTDGDTVGDLCDNCPDHYNPGQEDINGNGVGDVCDYVCGDIDGKAGVDILDIVFLINNIYKGGADPDPLEAADVNHDYAINILDAVHLINFVYKGGSDPECVVW